MRITTRSVRAAAAAATALVCVACGSRGTTTGPSTSSSGAPGFSVAPPPGGSASFTVSPVDVSIPNSLTALGNLNPPGHVLPTDHVYFYQGSLATLNPFGSNATRTVYMPTKASVLQVLTSTGGTDWKVYFIVTATFQFYFDHLTPRAGLAVGQTINAGDVVGTSNTTLDFGAFDYSTTLPGFVAPSRYPDQTLHCVSPWKYFVEPLRSQLYANVYRAPSAPDRDGKIDFDIPGRLSGDWFDPSVSSSADPSSWTRTIAFAYDYYDPSLVRISIGGTVAPPGVWAIDPAAPRPADVSVATGKVIYRLLYQDSTLGQYGVMVVQMLSDTSIKVEVFPGGTAATPDFDGGAYTWIR